MWEVGDAVRSAVYVARVGSGDAEPVNRRQQAAAYLRIARQSSP